MNNNFLSIYSKTKKHNYTKNITDIENIKEYLKPYILKRNYNIVIPLDIYQTWHTKKLPPKMFECVKKLKETNPIFRHHLYDDADCREFIKNNFNNDVLWAFDNLIPGAYKADLWRLCILYINGGIYIDIKFSCFNGFKLIELTESEHFVADVPPHSIYNALMVCKKGNPFLLKSIEQIVENVKNKYYGTSPLSPTGPLMLGKVILDNNLDENFTQNIDMKHYENLKGRFILYKKRFVIYTIYPEYKYEQSKYHTQEHYEVLWANKNVYK